MPMNEQCAASRPTQSGAFVFPEGVWDPAHQEIDPRLRGQLVAGSTRDRSAFVSPEGVWDPARQEIDPRLRGQLAAGSNRDRLAAELRAASVQPSASANAAGTKGGPNLNRTSAALEINGLKERILVLEEENEALKDAISKIERDAKKEKHRVGEELIAIREFIETVQQESEGRSERMDVDTSSEDSDNKETILDAETTLKLEKSDAAASSNVFLALLRQVFCEGMGCPNKLTGEVLPAYPDETEAWPMITRAGFEVQAMRFRWDKTYSDSVNWRNIQWIMKEIRKNGPQYSPAAAAAIAEISDDDLQTRVVWKFNELVKTVKAWNKVQQAAAARVVVVVSSSPEAEGAGTTGEVGIGTTAVGTVVPKELTIGVKNSRAKGKLDVRVRKRANLDQKHELRNKKYDPAMVYTLMSEDEDSFKDGQIIKTEFTSRPPVYRSVELQQFYNAIDKLSDPMPAQKYVKRVAGIPKDIPPPIAKKLENRARRWMISPDWLGRPENKGYDMPSRIAASGVAWGDEKDPEEIEATQQRVKEEKADIKRQKIKTEGGDKKERAKPKKGKGREKVRAVSKQPVASSSRAQSSDDLYE